MAREWGTESGLLTDYTGTVVEAWFGHNERFGGMQLMLKQTTDSVVQPEFVEQFSTGASWDTPDGGDSVVNIEDSSKWKFHRNSRVGKLIDRCIELGMGEMMSQRGEMTEAKSWVGLTFHWEEVTAPWTRKNDETGKMEEGISRYNLPDAFLGEGDSGSSVSSPASTPATTSALDGLDDSLVAQLREAHTASTTHHEFVDKAVGLTGVQGNVNLISAIADEDQLWKELANG